jgi:hypothetical protein
VAGALAAYPRYVRHTVEDRLAIGVLRWPRTTRTRASSGRNVGSHAGWALVLGGVILAILSLGACGESDPFVGSWATARDAPAVALIAQAGASDVYLVTLVRSPGSDVRLRLVRDGDVLSVTRPMHYPEPQGTVPRTFRFTRTEDGGLVYFEGEPGAVFAELRLVRVSDSTSGASPSTGVGP